MPIKVSGQLKLSAVCMEPPGVSYIVTFSFLPYVLVLRFELFRRCLPHFESDIVHCFCVWVPKGKANGGGGVFSVLFSCFRRHFWHSTRTLHISGVWRLTLSSSGRWWIVSVLFFSAGRGLSPSLTIRTAMFLFHSIFGRVECFGLRPGSSIVEKAATIRKALHLERSFLFYARGRKRDRESWRLKE